MPILRKVYGPFGFTEKGLRSYDSHELHWYFFGIRDDYSVAHWVLTYNVKQRKFLASSTGGGVIIGDLPYGRGLTKQGIGRMSGKSIHDKMFIENDDTPSWMGASQTFSAAN